MKFFALALMAMVVATLSIHAYLGTYSRYLADDFCTAGDVARLGFWGAQSNLYRTWSGRYSFSFVVALTHLAGPSITPFLPAVALALWVAAMTFLFSQWIQLRVGSRKWILSILLALISISAVLSASPNIYQSLYWQTGMLTYILPLVLFTAYLGFLCKVTRVPINGTRQKAVYLLGFIWPFFMGGFSETFVSVQTSGLLSGIVPTLFMTSSTSVQRLRRLVILGLLGSLAALILVASAPGNAVRQALLPAHPALFQVFKSTLKDWYIFTARTVKWHLLAIILLSTIAAYAGFILEAKKEASGGQSTSTLRRDMVWLASIPMLTFLLMCASIAPYEYAVASFPDARVLVTTVFVFFLGIVGWSFFLGTSASRLIGASSPWAGRIGLVVAMVSLGLYFVYARQAVQVALQDRDAMRNYAAAWDERDRKLRSAADENLEIIRAASLPHMGGGLAEIGYDPDEWINRCVASTYGFDQVIAK